jgi:hypothetical protein
MVGLGGMPEASNGCVRATYFKEETLRHVPCWKFFAEWAEGWDAVRAAESLADEKVRFVGFENSDTDEGMPRSRESQRVGLSLQDERAVR